MLRESVLPMDSNFTSDPILMQENRELRDRLNEVEELLGAIRSGEVDALVVDGPDGPRIFTVQGLEAESNRFRGEILAQVSDAVIAVDSERRITYLNPAAERLYGVTGSDALGMPQADVFQERPFRESTSEQCDTDGSQWRSELVQRLRDGREIVVESMVTPFYDGANTGYLSVIRDITERIEADEALNHLAAIVTSSGDAIATKDLNGIVTSWNKGAEQLFGYTAEEAIGKPITIVIPFDRLDEERLVLERIRRGEQIDHYETIRRRKDGSLIEISVSVSPLKDKEGKIVGAAKVARDITARRQAERALREADRRKDEFLAILAHELRNPLAPIRTAVQIIRLNGGSGNDVDEAIDMMDRQVNQVVRLVDDLLDVSRISRGKIELRTECIDLGASVEQAVQAIMPLSEGMSHHLELSLPPAKVYVVADPTRISQIIGNLLTNACKFTDPGGRVRVSVGTEGSQAVVRVQDNGVGIAADQLPRVFDMFMQVDTTLARSTGGLGLGLTLVQNLVGMHGGAVEAHSDGIGKGSEFVVRLPLCKDGPPTTSRERQTLDGEVGKKRVLIVDDNEDAARTLSMLLQLTGSETHVAYNGIDAVDAAERIRPDLIFLDIGLPGLNGFEACRKIREFPWSEGIKIVALTGWGQDEDRELSKEAGFDEHLVKPVDLATLRQMLAGSPGPKVSQDLA